MYLKTIKTLAFPNSPKNEFSGSHELKDFRSSPWRFLIRFLNSICFWPEWTRRYLHIPKGRLCVLWWGPAVWRQKLVLFRQQHLIVCRRSICTVQHSHTKSASCDDYRTMEQRVYSGGYDIPVNLREREREKERRTVPVVYTVLVHHPDSNVWLTYYLWWLRWNGSRKKKSILQHVSCVLEEWYVLAVLFRLDVINTLT